MDLFSNQTIMCDYRADDLFGPAINCDQFDFTLLFEQSILTIGPSALFLLAIPFHISHMYRSKRLHVERFQRCIHIAKMCLAILNLAMQIASIVLWTRSSITKVTTAAASIDLLCAIALVSLSVLEHERTIRPSSLLSVFLIASIASDAIQLRTLVERRYVQPIVPLLSTSIGCKVILFVLESWPRHPVSNGLALYGPEDLAGILSRWSFWWLNQLLIQGNRAVLALLELPRIDRSFESAPLQSHMQTCWSTYTPGRTRRFLVATISCLRWSLLNAVIPRLALIGFTYAQPFLITAAVDFLADPVVKRDASRAYGLVGGTALTYLGIAVSTAQYNHMVNRFLTEFRGAAASLLFHRSFSSSAKSNELAGITLMSTDVDRVVMSLQHVNEIWARLVEIGLGIWLLWKHVGVVAVAPVIIVAVCFFVELWISRYMGPKQGIWVQAVQRRVAAATTVLRSIKSIKLAGLTDAMGTLLQQERVRELNLAEGFRWLIVWLNVVANAPQLLSSLAVFAVVAIQRNVKNQPPLSASQTFSSLALISLITNPAALLLGSIPTVAASLGCIRRIEDFLIEDDLVDARNTVHPCTPLEDMSDKDIVLSINGAIVETAAPHSHPFNLTMHRRAVHMITGPVGCGKSTILKAILGENPLRSGNITTSTTRIGYCAQNPWIPNLSIRDVIVGPSADYDEMWYLAVIYVCDLSKDLQALPNGDSIKAGSRGLMLSGGQKQRISLARALYSRCSLLIIDDILSSLDQKTRKNVAQNLLGENGHVRRHNQTVVLVTSAVELLYLADSLSLFAADGSVVSSSPLDSPNDVPEVLEDEYVQHRIIEKGEARTNVTSVSDNGAGQKETARQIGDRSIWWYYAESIGTWRTITAIIIIAVNVLASNFPRLWLKWNGQSAHRPIEVFIGVYAMFVAVTYITQGAMIWAVMISIVPKSGAGLHQVLVNTAMRAPMSFFETTDSSQIVNRFSQDMTLVDGALPSFVFSIFMSMMQCIMQAALISLGSTYIAATIPVVILALYFIQRYYLRTSRQLRLLDLEARSPLYQHFTETLEGIITIRAFGWRDSINKSFLERLDESQKPYYLLYCIQRWLNLVLDLLVAGIAVLLVALALCVNTGATGANLGVALTTILAFNQTLQELISDWTQAETSLGAIARTKAFERDTPREEETDSIDPGIQWPAGRFMAKDLGVTCSNGMIALKGVTFTVDAGQKLSIIGRTGSGKSTLLSLLLRLQSPTHGAIEIDGVNILEIPRTKLHERIICVPQDPILFPGTFRFNLDPSGNVAATESFEDALQAVGLLELVNARGGICAELDTEALSHGEQQLLAFARAVLKKTTLVGSCILVLDEATSGMDDVAEDRVRSLVRDLWKNQTIITIAHRETALQDVDLVLELDQGRMVRFEKGS